MPQEGESTASREGMLQLCGLWKNVSQGSGKTFYSGQLGSARILIFENGFKKAGSNEPDAIVYIAKSIKRKDTNAAANQG